MSDLHHAARAGRWAVAAMFCTNGFIVGSWAPQIPLLLTRLEIRETTLGVLILLFGIGALVAMPLCGLMSHRHGSRAVLRTVAIASAFGLPLVLLAPNLLAVAPAMILFGALVGGTDVAMNTNAVAAEKKLGRAIMSSSHGFWSLGGFAGGGMGGITIAQVGYLTHGLIVAVVSLVVILVAARYLVTEDAPAPTQQEGARSLLPRHVGIYIVGLIALFAFVPEGSILDWAALYLRQELGADIATAGFAFAAFSATMAVVRFLGDGIRNRFGAVLTLRVSSLIAAVGLLIAGQAPDAYTAIAAFGFAGLGLANIVPIAFSAAGNQPGLSPAAGMSFVTTLGYSGILVAPSLIGFIGEHTGFASIFTALALFLVFICLAAGFARAADGARSSH
jgi:predicted MFS family arabinose efflux permease